MCIHTLCAFVAIRLGTWVQQHQKFLVCNKSFPVAPPTTNTDHEYTNRDCSTHVFVYTNRDCSTHVFVYTNRDCSTHVFVYSWPPFVVGQRPPKTYVTHY